MKLRTLLKFAHEIISEEVSTVYEEFREDDGSITFENKRDALALMERMTRFLVAANKVLGQERPKTGSARRRKQVERKIVVQK